MRVISIVETFANAKCLRIFNAVYCIDPIFKFNAKYPFYVVVVFNC